MTLHELKKIIDTLPSMPRMPVLFVGHGSPMNALEQNIYTRSWKDLGEKLPRPSAILSISAHWITEGTFVHVEAKPKIIHDFYGFPKELYALTYPCPGAPEVASATQEILTPTIVLPDSQWGIDHGTWVVLHHMFPNADIPVFQMSIDVSRSHEQHYELGRLLMPLREKGVLIMGSGNLVHNLGRIDFNEEAVPFDWALEFDTQAKNLLQDGDHRALINYENLGQSAAISIPTPDHYWPLLYALGLQEKNESLTFPVEGISHGSISMRAIKIG